MLDMADHVHNGNASLVESVDGRLGGDTDGADEELGLFLDDDIDKLVQSATSVVVVCCGHRGQQWTEWRWHTLNLLFLAPSPTADGETVSSMQSEHGAIRQPTFGKKEVNAKRSALVVEVLLELVDDFAQSFRRVAETPDHTKTAFEQQESEHVSQGGGRTHKSTKATAAPSLLVRRLTSIGDSSSQLRTGSNVHSVEIKKDRGMRFGSAGGTCGQALRTPQERWGVPKRDTEARVSMQAAQRQQQQHSTGSQCP